MKKILLLSFVVTALSFMISFSVLNRDMSKILIFDVESLARMEGEGKVCKWQEIDCPGWWSGDYEACVTNGDGNSCSCGDVTRNCD